MFSFHRKFKSTINTTTKSLLLDVCFDISFTDDNISTFKPSSETDILLSSNLINYYMIYVLTSIQNRSNVRLNI